MTKHVTDFGTILRNIRVNLGITVSALAKQIGVSQSYVTTVERGMRSAPKRDRLRAWLKALHCSERFDELHELAVLNRTSIYSRLIPKDPSNEDIVRIMDAYKANELTEMDRLTLSCLCRK
jgi:transcriptional regulator with XRE-family HTH domain